MTISQIKEITVPILQAYGIQRASVFGSTARGDVTPESDVDLLVKLPHPIGLLPFAGLKVELEDALKRKVDLVEYDALHPRMKDRVLADQVSIL